VTVVARRRCFDRREAEALRAVVVADNPSYVEVTTEDRDLVVRLTATSAASARTTLEDLLACLKAAERTAGVAASH
jgi:hypothetical protein